MLTYRLSRPACPGAALVLATAGLLLPAASASAATERAGTVTVSTAAKDPAAAALRKAKVKVSATKPASTTRRRWILPVAGVPKVTARRVDLDGRLRFARGKRSVTFTKLRLSLGTKPTVSGTVGKKRITILTLEGSPKRNATAGSMSLKNARTSLHSAGVRTLQSRLKTSRIKSGRLGKATVTVQTAAAAPQPAPAPAPAPGPGSAPLGPPVVVGPPPIPPAPDPPLGPEPVCWTPTPAGTTDWIGCGTQTGGNLRSWITYLGSGGSVEISNGATPLSTFNARLTPGAWEDDPDGPAGRIVNRHSGTFDYRYPSHGNLRVQIENVTFEVAADRASADVLVDATYNSFEDPTGPPEEKTQVTAMTVNLTAARTRTTVGDKTTFTMAPAFLTSAGRTIWSNFYEVGARFGAFTITVPDVIAAG